jgi:hypothetical protein
MRAPAIARVQTKNNLQRIEGNNLKASYKNMGSLHIVWSTLSFLGYRHRVGLLMLSTVGLLVYISWDKVGRLFF